MKNEPAFPIQGFSTRNGQGFQAVMADGMNLRDYFAAKAMQGAIAHGLFNADKASTGYAEYIANVSYAYADAMLKAREE